MFWTLRALNGDETQTSFLLFSGFQSLTSISIELTVITVTIALGTLSMGFLIYELRDRSLLDIYLAMCAPPLLFYLFAPGRSQATILAVFAFVYCLRASIRCPLSIKKLFLYLVAILSAVALFIIHNATFFLISTYLCMETIDKYGVSRLRFGHIPPIAIKILLYMSAFAALSFTLVRFEGLILRQIDPFSTAPSTGFTWLLAALLSAFYFIIAYYRCIVSYLAPILVLLVACVFLSQALDFNFFHLFRVIILPVWVVEIVYRLPTKRWSRKFGLGV